MLFSDAGKAVRSGRRRAADGRQARGVRGMKIAGRPARDLDAGRDSEKQTVLTATENGLAAHADLPITRATAAARRG